MHLVGLKEISDLLEVSYETVKVWNSRGRLPEPLQTVSGTPVWDWDESQAGFEQIPIHENKGRPKKQKINLGNGLIEIEVDKDSNEKKVKIKLLGKERLNIEAEEDTSETKGIKIKFFGKDIVDLNLEDLKNIDNKDIDIEIDDSDIK